MFCMKKKNSGRSKGSVDRTQDSKHKPDSGRSPASPLPAGKDSAPLQKKKQSTSTAPHSAAASSTPAPIPKIDVTKGGLDESSASAQATTDVSQSLSMRRQRSESLISTMSDETLRNKIWQLKALIMALQSKETSLVQQRKDVEDKLRILEIALARAEDQSDDHHA